jgi:hypothetical protein
VGSRPEKEGSRLGRVVTIKSGPILPEPAQVGRYGRARRAQNVPGMAESDGRCRSLRVIAGRLTWPPNLDLCIFPRHSSVRRPVRTSRKARGHRIDAGPDHREIPVQGRLGASSDLPPPWRQWHFSYWHWLHGLGDRPCLAGPAYPHRRDSQLRATLWAPSPGERPVLPTMRCTDQRLAIVIGDSYNYEI